MEIKLFQKQLTALQYLTDENWQGEMLFGGGARGGKSYLSCNWLVSSCFAFPGSRWLLGFAQLNQLRNTTLADLIGIIKLYSEPINGKNWRSIFKLNQIDMKIEFINGSIIYCKELADLPSDPHFDRLGSLSLTGFAVDEAQRVSKKAISTLQARLSLTKGKGWKTRPKALYTCNPSKGWTYQDFYKPLIKEKQENPNKVFIVSLYTDNPFIDHEEYKQQVLRTGDKIQIERLLYGNFDYDDADDKLINYDKILDIFSNFVENSDTKHIICDVARLGKDKTIIHIWKGWNLFERHEIAKSDLTVIVALIESLRGKYGIGRSSVLVDEGGVGGGVVDFGKYKGFISNASQIEDSKNQFTLNKVFTNYKNLKAQCCFGLAKMINESKIQISCELTSRQKELIIEDLDSFKQFNIEKDGKIQVLPKDKQKEILGRSPDDGDTLMMRFYFELKKPLSLNF